MLYFFCLFPSSKLFLIIEILQQKYKNISKIQINQWFLNMIKYFCCKMRVKRLLQTKK